MADTAVAQAAVPQAWVRPTPRSQVRILMAVRERDGGKCDVGALGENRVVLEQGAEATEIVCFDVVDPEDRVRVANIHDRG